MLVADCRMKTVGDGNLLSWCYCRSLVLVADCRMKTVGDGNLLSWC